MFFFLFFMAMVLPLPSHGAAGEMPSWQKYIFDGKKFQEGTSSLGLSLYMKEGYLPFIKAPNEALREDRLPSGTGGLVILCYIETAGGKLQSQSGYIPFPRAAVQIRNGERLIATRSDEEGYSILALPAGKYDIQVQKVTSTVLVEKGKTILVTIRAGKRMVD